MPCHAPAPRPRPDRPLTDQHDEWMAHLRRQVVSRRTIITGAVGAAAGSLLLGAGNWSDQAVAATLASTGTIAEGFVVNGRHWLEYGADRSYGHVVAAEIRELLTHVPVWDGKPRCSRRPARSTPTSSSCTRT